MILAIDQANQAETGDFEFRISVQPPLRLTVLLACVF
jgi:hypothetical protein